MQKRLLAAAMAIGTSVILMTGCGEDKIVGEWTVSMVQFEGMTEPKPVEEAVREMASQYQNVSEEEILQVIEMYENIEIICNKDGTALTIYSGSGTSDSSQSSYEGNWGKNSDGTYYFSGNGEYTEVTMVGNTLVQQVEDEVTIIYSKN